jgi:hypothetical protein
MKKLKDEKTFWKTEVPTKIKTAIEVTAITTYLLSVFVLIWAFSINIFLVGDALFLFILGLGIHFKKIRVCACVLIIDFVISGVISSVERHSSSTFAFGGAFLTTCIFGVVATFQYHELWNLYLSTEDLTEIDEVIDENDEDIDIDLDDIIAYFNTESQSQGTDE